MFNSDNNFELDCCAARLLLDLIPALNGSDIFQDVVCFFNIFSLIYYFRYCTGLVMIQNVPVISHLCVG